jgi:hypothetical protein
MSTKVMELVSPYSGEMRCKVCGSTHFAAIKPGSEGQYQRGSWQCAQVSCPSNEKVWDESKESFIRAVNA